jgi:hypothetical protein
MQQLQQQLQQQRQQETLMKMEPEHQQQEGRKGCGRSMQCGGQLRKQSWLERQSGAWTCFSRRVGSSSSSSSSSSSQTRKLKPTWHGRRRPGFAVFAIVFGVDGWQRALLDL